jgi:hypothetical protein
MITSIVAQWAPGLESTHTKSLAPQALAHLTIFVNAERERIMYFALRGFSRSAIAYALRIVLRHSGDDNNVCTKHVKDLVAIEDRLSIEIWLVINSLMQDFRSGRIQESADTRVAQLVNAANSDGWKFFCMKTAAAHMIVAPGVSSRPEIKKTVDAELAQWKKKFNWDPDRVDLLHPGIVPEEQMALMLHSQHSSKRLVISAPTKEQ